MKLENLKVRALVKHLYYEIPSIVELQVDQIMKDGNVIITALHLIFVMEKQTIKSRQNSGKIHYKVYEVPTHYTTQNTRINLRK